jgi:hypothetical protein
MVNEPGSRERAFPAGLCHAAARHNPGKKTGTKPVKVNAEQRTDGAPGIHQELAARLKKLPPSVTPAQLALVVADVGRFPAAFHTVAW